VPCVSSEFYINYWVWRGLGAGFAPRLQSDLKIHYWQEKVTVKAQPLHKLQSIGQSIDCSTLIVHDLAHDKGRLPKYLGVWSMHGYVGGHSWAIAWCPDTEVCLLPVHRQSSNALRVWTISYGKAVYVESFVSCSPSMMQARGYKVASSWLSARTGAEPYAALTYWRTMHRGM
jgi:hypothetical protein